MFYFRILVFGLKIGKNTDDNVIFSVFIRSIVLNPKNRKKPEF